MTRLTLSQQLETALADKEHLFKEYQEVRQANLTAVATMEQLREEVRILRHNNEGLDLQLGDAKQQLAETKRKLADKESSYTYAAEARNKAEGELEQVHAILDSLEGAPSRTFTAPGAYSETTRTLSARFAVCLCTIFRLTSQIKKD